MKKKINAKENPANVQKNTETQSDHDKAIAMFKLAQSQNAFSGYQSKIKTI